MRIAKSDLKKQTQFVNGQNKCIVNYNKEIREIYWIGHLVKTNPIQSQTKPICRPSAGNPKHEVRNPKQDERVCLKKQSQC